MQCPRRPFYSIYYYLISRVNWFELTLYFTANDVAGGDIVEVEDRILLQEKQEEEGHSGVVEVFMGCRTGSTSSAVIETSHHDKHQQYHDDDRSITGESMWMPRCVVQKWKEGYRNVTSSGAYTTNVVVAGATVTGKFQ